MTGYTPEPGGVKMLNLSTANAMAQRAVLRLMHQAMVALAKRELDEVVQALDRAGNALLDNLEVADEIAAIVDANVRMGKHIRLPGDEDG